MALITRSDFKGNVKISQNTKETDDLTLYIERNQEQLLRDLMGDYQLSIYNTSPNSSTTKYVALITGTDAAGEQFYYYDKEGIYTSYYGIVEALKYFTYWDYVRNLNAKATSVGIRFADAENSTGSTQLQVNSVIEQRYNLGVEIYQAACSFLHNMYDCKLHYFGITEAAPGEYQMTVKNDPGKNSINLCSLLNQGDTFELDGIDYTVIINDVGTNPGQVLIDFTGDPGLTFTDKYIYINLFI